VDGVHTGDGEGGGLGDGVSHVADVNRSGNLLEKMPVSLTQKCMIEGVFYAFTAQTGVNLQGSR
jgi:hypothetical protein